MRLRVLHSVAQTKRFTPENFPSKTDFSLRAERWPKGGSRPRSRRSPPSRNVLHSGQIPKFVGSRVWMRAVRYSPLSFSYGILMVGHVNRDNLRAWER